VIKKPQKVGSQPPLSPFGVCDYTISEKFKQELPERRTTTITLPF